MKPKSRTIGAGDTLTTQGEAATDVYVVMDGMFSVEIDGEGVAEIGPGAVVGERAVLEGGVRTATLRATTRARVAAIAPDQLNPETLESLAATRRTAAPTA
jgi:CRP-like cAMP-binding protein